MKFYTFPKAPSPQRVHIFMKEKGIEIPTQLVDFLTGEHRSIGYRTINPRGTVPALVLDDGTVLSEVVAICRYLEYEFPEIKLLGDSASEQALITEWDHRIELECIAAIADALRNKGDAFKGRALPGNLNLEQIPELVTRGKLRIAAFFEIMNEQLEHNQFIAGSGFSMADITAFVAVGFAAWTKMTVPDELVHLKRWHAEVSARPSVK